MATALGHGIHIALNYPRVFGFTGLTLLVEVLIRFVLAATVHPVLAILWPPVVGVTLLGAGAPSVRKLVDGSETTPPLNLSSRLHEIGLRLLAIAVVGHLGALILGVSVFLVVDTAIRFVVYSVGGTVPSGLVFFLPLPGVAAGTLIAWGLLVPAVEQIVSGGTLRAAAVNSLECVFDRRRTASTLSLHVGSVLVGTVVLGFCLALTNEQYATQEAAFIVLFTMIAVSVATLLLVGVFVYPIHIALATESPNRSPAIPVGQLALAVLLVTGLVVGAGTIRIMETRPVTADTAPTPIPADPTDGYAVAIERTSAIDHRFVQTQRRVDDRISFSAVVERSSRQMRISISSEGRSFDGYTDSGVVYELNAITTDLYTLGERRVDDGVVRSEPGYWALSSEYTLTDNGGFDLPEPSTGAWKIVEQENGTKTLELTSDGAVFDSVLPVDTENVSAETAWIRMRVDVECGVVLGGRARLNGTYNDYDDFRINREYNYTIETGNTVDATRPDALGSRSLGEWTWDLFAY